MLTISKPLSASQAITYHEEKFANGAENYYAAGAEIKGQWTGTLAEQFGLIGDVENAQFSRLAEGRHPITDATLVRAKVATPYVNERGETVSPMEHRAGWDLTFSAPKSISLVALVGGDARIQTAHREAVATALRELEPYVQARVDARTTETTGKWAAATFEHDSARPVNGYSAPQLHTHVVVFNVTETSQGQMRSLQPRELYKSQGFATAVYRSELARQLVGLGYEVERGASNQPEIRGLSKEYLEASSPRRRQILNHLKREQRTGAGAAQIAAHQTREAKIQHAHAGMQRRHQEMAVSFGNQSARAIAAAQARGPEQVMTSHTLPDQAAAAVSFAKHRNIEREAVIDERSILRDALQRSMGTVPVNRIKSEFAGRVAAGEFLQHEAKPGAAGRLFTTPEMVILEQETIAAMLSGQNRHQELASAHTRAVVAAEHPDLYAGQRAAVRHILESRDTVTALEGVAGAGKTTALAAVRAGADREGYRVTGLAPTSRAAQKLAEAGMPTQTLQRHLKQLENGNILRTGSQDIGARTLYVLDESSLASTVQMHAFLSGLQAHDRVLLVGDTRQHQSVDAGRSYEQLQEAGLRTASLDDIVRQPDPAYKAVVEQLSQGETRAAIAALDEQGRVHEVPRRDDRLKAIAEAFSAHPGVTIVVSPDNQSRTELNDAIHQALTAQGAVRAKAHQTTVLIPRQDMTGADRALAHRYHEGDVIRYTNGSKPLGLVSGDRAKVERVNDATNELTVRHVSTGVRITYDPRELQGVSLYREADRAFAIGDRVQFTAPFREQRVANRELGTITALPSGTMKVKLDSGRSVGFHLKDYPHVDYGYAVTSHNSQGQTADRVIVHIDTDRAGEALVNQRLAYVALSRGRYDAQIFTNDKAQLTNALSRDVSHRSAVQQAKLRPHHELALSEP